MLRNVKTGGVNYNPLYDRVSGYFGVKASDESTAQGVFAVSVKSDANAITTSNAAHSPRNDNKINPLPLGEGGTQCRVRVKKAAFTLAEVLITLAIIGIVAALTIPTLIQNFQQEAWDTASEVFQRKLEESLKVMNVQGTLAGYTTTEAFVDELSKHIKITKICKNDDITSCFEDKVYWGSENEEIDTTILKTAKNFGLEEWDTEILGVQFANGTTGLIAYNPNCYQDPYSNQVDTFNCLAILYDTSAYKLPNTSSKDLRSINVSKLGLSCFKEFEGMCILAEAFTPDASPITEEDCNNLISEGYLKECFAGNDPVAVAANTCRSLGGRLTNREELAKIASYIYETPISADRDDTSWSLYRNIEKASEFGYVFRGNVLAYAYTSDEVEGERAEVYEFAYGPFQAYFYQGDRFTYGPYWAVCVH